MTTRLVVVIRDAAARARLPKQLRFHDLRHTCAALLIANGRHMEETKDHLGHPSIRVTSDRHGHLFPRTPRELADGLDETYRMQRRPAGPTCARYVTSASPEHARPLREP
jgi:integrase